MPKDASRGRGSGVLPFRERTDLSLHGNANGDQRGNRPPVKRGWRQLRKWGCNPMGATEWDNGGIQVGYRWDAGGYWLDTG